MKKLGLMFLAMPKEKKEFVSGLILLLILISMFFLISWPYNIYLMIVTIIFLIIAGIFLEENK